MSNAARNRVLLLYPAAEQEQSSLIPLSLLYVAQPLLDEGIEVTIIDQRVEKDFFDELRRRITPDLLCIGISCITGPQIKQVISIGEFIREKTDTPVVLGGPHPTLLPEQTLESPLVDYVVIGRGEEPFLKLVRALKGGDSMEGIANIGYKRKGKVHTRKAPATAPPTREIPYHLLSRYGRPATVPILTSWGCPYHCNFCVEKVLQPTFYQLPPGDVFRMIEEALRLNPQFLNFFDDNFLLNRERVVKIFSLCRDRGLDFRWLCTGRADVVFNLDNETLQFLKQNGLFGIYFGIESGSPGILELIRKGITPAIALELNRRMKEEGIIPHYGFMAGFPTETEEDRRMTLDLMKRLKEENPRAVIWKINQYTPYPGTGLYDLAVQNGYRPPETLEEWREAHFYSRGYGEPFDARY